MSMDVNVRITLSDRLFGLLEEKLPNLGRRVERSVEKEIKARIWEESEVAVSVSPGEPGADSAAPLAVSVTASAPESTQTPEPQAEPQTAPEAKPRKKAPKAPKTPEPAQAPAAVAAPHKDTAPTPQEMKERVRGIMHRTRQRFEGENYLNETDSEAYRKYHRPLNTQFKLIAVSLGYEKPTSIDDPAIIDRFEAECELLIINDEGLISPPPDSAPF